MQVWTTEALPERQKFSYWREVICEAFVSLEPVSKQTETAFVGEVNSRQLSRTARTTVFSRAQFINRRWEEIRRNPVEYCFANFQLEGSCAVRQDGQETLVHPGDFSIVDTTRPYFLDFRDDWRVLSFRIPRSQLVSRLAAPHKATARSVSGQSGLGLVATRFARSLEHVSDSDGIAVQEALSTALNGIIATALGATVETQERDRVPVREAFRKAVETYITDHLTDPELGPDMIAARFRVSRRTLYGLFEEEALSVSGMIREQRLQRSACEIRNSHRPNILAIAMKSGFNDASHFSRLFKTRFGVAPRDFSEGKQD